MSGTIWTKFFWSDWQADPALRLCSYAARGLWMDMLCIAATHDPIGYVSVAGRGLSETDIARMTGGSESEAHALILELEQNGVFSRDRKGTIYSRRMIGDAKKSAIAMKNGKKGGNPNLSNETVILPSVKGEVKPPDKPQEPLPITQTELKELPDRSGQRNSYPDDFQAFWKAYPTDPNMSKKEAFKEWRRLSPEKRIAAMAGVPGFRRYCEANKWYRPQYADGFLKEEKFEGYTAEPSLSPEQIAENMDKADRLMRRGKYAENAA